MWSIAHEEYRPSGVEAHVTDFVRLLMMGVGWFTLSKVQRGLLTLVPSFDAALVGVRMRVAKHGLALVQPSTATDLAGVGVGIAVVEIIASSFSWSLVSSSLLSSPSSTSCVVDRYSWNPSNRADEAIGLEKPSIRNLCPRGAAIVVISMSENTAEISFPSALSSSLLVGAGISAA